MFGMRLLTALLILCTTAATAGPFRNDVTILEDFGRRLFVEVGNDRGFLYRDFHHDFTNPDFRQWFGEGLWTSMNIQSPSAQTVDDYHRLRVAILDGADFIDNRIEAVDGVARFTAVAPGEGMVTSKSMIQNDSLWFVKGDDLWFSADYLLAEGTPFTLVDFQERGRNQSPGPRVFLSDGEFLQLELKHFLKPKLRQRDVAVPRGEWFTLKVHLLLDDDNGYAEIWQDGVKVVEGPIQTLPAANSILNALEVGITATSEAAVLLVDNVRISHDPF